MAKSETSVVVSDIHFPYQDKKCWKSFKEFVQNNNITNIYVNGDIWDLESLSTFPKGKDAKPHIVPEIKQGIKELNELKKSIMGEMFIVPGNHEDRWNRRITEAFGMTGNGLKLLSLAEQLYAQGLDRSIKVVPETIHNIGCKYGQFVIRHGDKQASKSGGWKNVATNRLQKTLGTSEVVGHFHVAQMACVTFDGKTAIGIANPCLTGPHAYAIGASWQRGFTILEKASNNWVTPYVVVMHNGKFSYAGRTYG